MPTLDERVAYLEGRLEDHSTSVNGFREELRLGLGRLDGRMDRLDGRMDRLDDKLSRQFVWIIGIQVTVLVAIFGALFANP